LPVDDQLAVPDLLEVKELELGVGVGERRRNVVVMPGVGDPPDDPLAILRGLLSR
jgi:hypothetical protein